MEQEEEAMAVQTVELKTLQVYEEGGVYKEKYIDSEKHPAMLTNYSLKVGKDSGLIKGSLLADIMHLQKLQDVKDDPDQAAEAMERLDTTECLKVIFLACSGLKKDFKYSFDEFAERYHEDTQTTIQTYAELIADLADKDPNQFAKSLQDSTKKKPKKGKRNHQNSKSKR